MSGNSDALILAALERLEAGQTQLRAELATRMERLQDAVAAVETSIAAMETRIAAVETSIAAMETRIAAIETRMDAQDETLGRFRADLVDELGRTRSVLMARMDRLQDALVSQHEADVVNFGAAERAERIAKGAVDEGRILGEQFNALVRQVRRLEEEVRILRGGV